MADGARVEALGHPGAVGPVEVLAGGLVEKQEPSSPLIRSIWSL
jgi:hypothetical protein